MGHKYSFNTVQTDLRKLCEGYKLNREHYIVPCPNCIEHAEELGIDNAENKLKLYITKDFSCGFCQRCKSKFFNPRVKDGLDSTLDELVIPKFDYEPFRTDYEIDKINVDYYNLSSDYSENEVKYLIHRNFALEKLYPYLKFKFRKNKVVMPFFWNNEVIYYQTRMTLPRDKCTVPYFCPPCNNKPIWVNPINRGSNEVILTEGIFGAIGAWLKFGTKRDVISVQGSYLTGYQLWMLDNLSYDKFYIYYDEDEISKNIMKIMREHNSMIYNDLEIIHSEHGDPEDDYLNKTVEH